MAQPRKFPVLPGKKDLACEGAMTGHQLEQAAEMVTEFAGHTTVPALDRLLAAEGAIAQSSAAELGRAALEVTHQTEMLYDEVARFLTLAPDD